MPTRLSPTADRHRPSRRQRLAPRTHAGGLRARDRRRAPTSSSPIWCRPRTTCSSRGTRTTSPTRPTSPPIPNSPARKTTKTIDGADDHRLVHRGFHARRAEDAARARNACRSCAPPTPPMTASSRSRRSPRSSRSPSGARRRRADDRHLSRDQASDLFRVDRPPDRRAAGRRAERGGLGHGRRAGVHPVVRGQQPQAPPHADQGAPDPADGRARAARPTAPRRAMRR